MRPLSALSLGGQNQNFVHPPNPPLKRFFRRKAAVKRQKRSQMPVHFKNILPILPPSLKTLTRTAFTAGMMIVFSSYPILPVLTLNHSPPGATFWQVTSYLKTKTSYLIKYLIINALRPKR
jgi:hypothetical protein